eukprot:m.150164 g.150164  ORF g.150164 m.150164 type:complete len:89 (-) comp13280_c0_seq6:438-704(-)
MKGLRNELKYVFSSEEKTTIPSRVSSHLYCGHHALCNIATKTLQHKYVHFDVPNRFSTNNTEFLEVNWSSCGVEIRDEGCERPCHRFT